MKMLLTTANDDQLHAYCAMDSLSTAVIWPVLYQDAEEAGVTKHFHERTMPLAREVLRMQNRGMPFSLAQSQLVEGGLQLNTKKIERKVRKLMGTDFRLSADADLIAFLHGRPEDGGLALAVHRRTEKLQRPKADEETLLWYRDLMDRPQIRRQLGEAGSDKVANLIDWKLEWKELHDLCVEYVVNVRVHVREGRMYCRLLIHVVPTTRLACRQPNLQNQPKRCNPEIGKQIRNQYTVAELLKLKEKGFRVGPLADPGPLLQVHDSFLWQVWCMDHWEFWEQDLQAAEKRISYLESGDSLGLERLEAYDKLMKAGKYEEALQFETHRANALDCFGPFGLRMSDITNRLRDFMKNVSYGEGYGGQAETMPLDPDLLDMLQKITHRRGRDAVKAAMDNYREKHVRETEWREEIAQQIRANRCLRDEGYGTVRFFFSHIKDDIRSGLNDPCQRGVAHIMNDALRAMSAENWLLLKNDRALREQMDRYVIQPIHWSSGITASIPTEWSRSRAGWGSLEEWR